MDWKQLILEITSSGMTQAEVAAEAGLAQSAISDLVTGKTTEPRYSTGKKLVAIRRNRLSKRKRNSSPPSAFCTGGASTPEAKG